MMGAQRDAAWYDGMCRVNAVRRARAPEDQPWYPLWARVDAILCGIDRPVVVELGCGPGAFAELLFRRAPATQYAGYDFSAENVRLALGRGLPTNFEFRIADVTVDDVDIARPAETAVVAVEVMEHLDDDLGVLRRLPTGVFCILTLPDHDSEAHVRWFESADGVRARYGGLFLQLTVETISIGERTYFIAYGVTG